MLALMPRSFDQLVDEFNAGRLAYRDFEQLVKETTPVPALVLSQMQEAYAAARASGFPKPRPRGVERDLVRLSNALEMALAVPDRSYTATLCEIAADPESRLGLQEMALEVLWELCDPASFEPMVELCCRPDLKFDPTDWRKALWVIMCPSNERRRVIEALQAIERTGNILQRDAAEYLRMV